MWFLYLLIGMFFAYACKVEAAEADGGERMLFTGDFLQIAVFVVLWPVALAKVLPPVEEISLDNLVLWKKAEVLTDDSSETPEIEGAHGRGRRASRSRAADNSA